MTGQLQSCCGCFSLEAGGLILGWWGIIKSIIGLAVIGVCMANAKNKPIYHHDDFGSVKKNIYSTLMYLLVSFILNLITYIFLLVGVQLKKHVFLIPWLIVQMIAIFEITCLVFIFGGNPFDAGATGAGIITLLVGLLISGLHLYWWSCIASLYKKMRQEANASGGVGGVVYHPGTHVQCGPGIPPSYDQIAQKV